MTSTTATRSLVHPPRVPRGVPSGGQYAEGVKDEASGVSLDPWTLPLPTGSPRTPGLDLVSDAKFQDLDDRVAALEADQLSDEEQAEYLTYAAAADEAVARGEQGRVPTCPVHRAAWGDDDTCVACTENGAPLPYTDRFTISDRIDDVTRAQIRHNVAARRRDESVEAGNYSLSMAREHLAASEEAIDHFDADTYEAMEAFDAAMEQARFIFLEDGDHEAYADTLDYIANHEADRYADLAEAGDDGIWHLQDAANWFRGAASYR